MGKDKKDSPSTSGEEEEEYSVEKVLDKRIVKGKDILNTLKYSLFNFLTVDYMRTCVFIDYFITVKSGMLHFKSINVKLLSKRNKT